MKPYTCLAKNLDSLYLSCNVANREVIKGYYELLEDRKKAAQAGGLGEVKLGDRIFTLLPYGRSGYKYVLKGSGFDVRLGSDSEYIPAMYVEFRSVFLWSYGLEGALDDFKKWVSSLNLELFDERVSRCDYCLDFYVPNYELKKEKVTTRFKFYSLYGEYVGSPPDTLQLGKGDVGIRIYNKSKEVKKSLKFWLYDVWKVEKDVWRVEFQLRKRFLRDFNIVTVEDLELALGDVLLYLTTEHTRLEDDKGLDRLWAKVIYELQELNFSGIVRDRGYKSVIDDQKRNTLNAIRGHLAKYAALMSVERGDIVTFDDVVVEVIRCIRSEIENFEYPFDKVVNEKIIKLYNELVVW